MRTPAPPTARGTAAQPAGRLPDAAYLPALAGSDRRGQTASRKVSGCGRKIVTDGAAQGYRTDDLGVYSEPMADYTDAEKDTIRRGVFGAMALVSKADPGFFAMFKESAAGSRAISAAPESIRALLAGGLVMPPTGSAEQVDAAIMGDLSQAMQILGKDAADQSGFKQVVEAAVQQVAEASDGVAPEEQAVIARVRAALSGAGTAAGSSGSDGTDALPPVLGT